MSGRECESEGASVLGASSEGPRDDVRGLTGVFPELRFVVTTRSPRVLAGLSREEIVTLGQDELGIDPMHPSDLGRDLQRYSFLIADPLRSDSEEQEMHDIQKRLAEAGVDPGWEPVARMQEPM